MIKRIFLGLCLGALCSTMQGADMVWFDGQHAVTYEVQGKRDVVVESALRMFAGDMKQVTGMEAQAKRKGTIQIYQLNKNRGAISKLRKMGVPVDSVAGHADAFYVGVLPASQQLVVAGANGRGCAYGILELSRMAGVSPWIWWGDVVPARRQQLTVSDDFHSVQVPSVTYRGIFINDEDWSLRNWSWKQVEDGHEFGVIGPKTYQAIFQLLLRLRANVIWPAMHEGTAGFFTVKGNREMADSFAILIGSSHCEPLLRNNVAEWDHDERGDYNYMTNREQVKRYWAERLQEVRGSEELFTIGMRGIHDGSMLGVKTKEEKLAGLQQVIDDQRELIRQYYAKDVERVPQVFIPYKEVLEIMESGLRVPDDVTLMWCDDNYGYMTRLSDDEQQRRPGGGGVYYHLSYWGRPHDYLWLTTTQPGLIYSEMKAAYDHHCRRLWIANVHDPKVAAYDLELFLDMAWNIEVVKPQTLRQHLAQWLCTQFGTRAGQRLAPAMEEFYRLCAIRKPEFMGWTQVELSDRKAYPRGRSQVVDTEFSTTAFGNELERYLGDYAAISETVREVEAMIPTTLKDAYFAHVLYPVLAAQAMAVKMLEAQRARSYYQGQSGRSTIQREQQATPAAVRSLAAYRQIQKLTEEYQRIAGGKWQGLMTMMPRDLNVFNPPILPYLPDGDKDAEPYTYNRRTTVQDAVAMDACRYQHATAGCQPIQLLGHSMNAVAIPKGGALTYEFTTEQGGPATLYTAMIPTQPNDRGDLRYEVTIDSQQPVVISLKEKYRSEFWKVSVLRGQALKQVSVDVEKGRHRLTVRALDDHIIMDQWMLDFQTKRKFYMIPRP